jgi:hypothetical protein
MSKNRIKQEKKINITDLEKYIRLTSSSHANMEIMSWIIKIPITNVIPMTRHIPLISH